MQNIKLLHNFKVWQLLAWITNSWSLVWSIDYTSSRVHLILFLHGLKTKYFKFFYTILFHSAQFKYFLYTVFSETNLPCKNRIRCILFIHISKNGKKGEVTLLIRGRSMRNNRDRYGHIYLFLTKKQKQSDLANICPSVRKTCVHWNLGTSVDNCIRGFFGVHGVWHS